MLGNFCLVSICCHTVITDLTTTSAHGISSRWIVFVPQLFMSILTIVIRRVKLRCICCSYLSIFYNDFYSFTISFTVVCFSFNTCSIKFVSTGWHFISIIDHVVKLDLYSIFVSSCISSRNDNIVGHSYDTCTPERTKVSITINNRFKVFRILDLCSCSFWSDNGWRRSQ